MVTGPHCDGWPINHLAGDAESGTIWAGGGGDWHGAGVWRSDDGGESWQVTRLTKGAVDGWAANDPDFARMIGWTDAPLPFGDGFSQIRSLCYAHSRLYAGTKPASLLQSLDGGRTWERIEALNEHPSAASWDPGAALALANCHSKSKVPTALLNEPAALRRAMLVAAAAEVPARAGRPRLRSADFAWLEMPTGPGQELVEDVIHTLRALRCADALRQRGTVLKTSGSYEIFVDERSANAVFALRPDPAHLYVLEVPEPTPLARRTSPAASSTLAATCASPSTTARSATSRRCARWRGARRWWCRTSRPTRSEASSGATWTRIPASGGRRTSAS